VEQARRRLTAREAAEYAGISPALVYKLCDERRLPHYRVGGCGRRGKILIDADDLDTFLASCRQEAREQAAQPPPLKHIKLQARHG
jgi:excisionase family DNA binding protein